MDIASAQRALVDSKASLATESACRAATETLDEAARFVGKNLGNRSEILNSFESETGTSLWSQLGKLWPAVADGLNPSPSNKASGSRATSEGTIAALAVAAARLERNLVAGVFEYQEQARAHEPDVRRLIFHVTTFVRIEEPEFFMLQAVLAQLLSNLVSPTGDPGSEELADAQLELYLSGNREEDVVIRLLDSRDARTNNATLHLINNLTQDNGRLSTLLSPVGVRWLAQLLGRMDDWLDAEDGRFELAARLFTRLIDAELQGKLWDALSASEEPVTPSQTTLLKLVDSALASSGPDHANPDPSPNAFILPAWQSLATYAATSMRSGIDDGRLPKVLAALVLATEALSAIALAAQERGDISKRDNTIVEVGGDEALVASMKGRGEGKSVIPSLVELLKESATFLPRVKPGEKEPETALPFANVKRDLVRLIGVLAYDDIGFGDALREAGGVELVLSLCETDDRNPYLREHALLAVRNLMTGNPANQEIIKQLDPLGVVGDDGELLPLPEKMRKGAASMAGQP